MGILIMGVGLLECGSRKQSHSGGPPPLTIKMSWPGVVNCQPECSQFGSIWDGLIRDIAHLLVINALCPPFRVLVINALCPLFAIDGLGLSVAERRTRQFRAPGQN